MARSVIAILGSSPLARGLRSFMRGEAFEIRIIPARAGFTRSVMASFQVLVDHPRSRGVYRAAWSPGPMAKGSSPLARGLPKLAAMTKCAWEDHPRSRGVYFVIVMVSQGDWGSSPLARGLHLRILGIPTNPYSTRPLLPSLPT